MAAEQLRQNLLRETGVTCWFPRYGLPGAAPSHEVCMQSAQASALEPESIVDLPSELITSPLLNPAPPRVPAGRISLSGSHAAADMLKSLKASTDAVLPSQKPASAPEPAPQVQAQIIQHVAEPFGFSWFAIDKRLSVLAMLPPGASRLSATCRVMLQRMLVALHEPWQSQGLEEQSYHWPFADDPELVADANAARQAVEGFIARRLRVQHSAMLLVLGDQIPWFLQQSAEEANEVAAGQLRIHRQYDLAMLCTHALHRMEQDAGLKRAAWQSMQVLRERLGRT